MRLSRVAASALVFLGVVLAATATGAATDEYAALENELEELRVTLSIPGMSAGVVRDGSLVWSAGFGESDLDTGEPVSPATPFGLASVTKPIAATLIMQLVEEGLIGLDDPVDDYGVSIPGAPGVTVRQLLTHTSEGTPGEVHRYDGNRYAYLGGVIEGATGETFATQLGDRILLPLGMDDSALNPINSWGGASRNGWEEFRYAFGWGEQFRSYPNVYGKQASPYQLDETFSVVDGMWQVSHSPAAGMLSTVEDLARFEIALSAGELLEPESQAEMLRMQVETYPDRPELGYGLGWYTQEYQSLTIQWHTGRWPPSTSALYLRVPELDTAFFVLANTDNLTVPFPWLGDGDVTGSALALAFVRHVLINQVHGEIPPAVDWSADSGTIANQLAAASGPTTAEFLERELWARRQAFSASGNQERVNALAAAAGMAFPGSTMRADRHYVATVDGTVAIAPSPGPSSFSMIARIALLWVSVVAVALVWMVVRLLRQRERSVWRWVVWLVAALTLGPFALLAVEPPTLIRSGVYGLSWATALIVLMSIGENPNGAQVLGSAVFIPWAFGVALVGAPVLARFEGVSALYALKKSLFGEFIHWGAAFVLVFPMTFLGDRVMSGLPSASSPYFHLLVSVAMLSGAFALALVDGRLVNAGVTTWLGSSGPTPATWKNAWRVAVVVFLAMVVSLFATIAWLA